MSDQVETQSPEERMMALLESEDAPNEAPEEELEGVEEEEEQQEDTEEEESDEEQPQATVKLKVNGEEVDKPLDEVIALAQQGMDYTQKTQKVAEERKSLEQYAQTLQVQEQKFQEQVQLQQTLIGDIAQITAIDNQLSRFQQVDWNALSDNDPVEAQKLFFQFNQLQGQRQQMANELGQKQQQIQQSQAERMQHALREGIEVLQRDIPGWSQEKAQELRSLGKDYGFSNEELSAILDPRVVKVLHDAIQWKKLQSSPVAKNKISEAKPVVKAGAKDPKQAQSSASREVAKQLKATGKAEYAQKLIERML